MFLGEELQLAQQMLVAQGVEGLVLEVGPPGIMDQPVAAVGQHPQGVHGLDPAAVMHAVKGQRRGAGHMQPVELARDAHPTLIDVDHRGLGEAALDGPLDRVERVVGPEIGLGQGAQAQGLAEEVQTGLAQPVKGQELLVEQIESQAAEMRTVLHGLRRPAGRRPGRSDRKRDTV